MPKATQSQRKSIYGVHPGVSMTQKWVAELKEKTGRSLDEWLRLIKKSGPKDEKARREWLKTNYGLGTNSAWWLAERAEGKGAEVGDPDGGRSGRSVSRCGAPEARADLASPIVSGQPWVPACAST